MDTLVHILNGFAVCLQPINLWYTFLGVFMGTIIVVLPGIGPSAGIALLIPVTFGMNPTSALIMMAGIYYGTKYGGSTTSILIRTPGEAASVMTSIDGYEMAKKGTLKESTYESLKKMIQTGVLQPGSRLTEVDLAARLKVSRTPLREALNRLERDGLVTNKPRHGYFVTMFDLRALEDAFDVREVLDGHAAQRATERIGAEDKKKLKAAVEKYVLSAWAKRCGEADPAEPTGLLTHHLVHDTETWKFLGPLQDWCANKPTINWRSAADLFPESGR